MFICIASKKTEAILNSISPIWEKLNGDRCSWFEDRKFSDFEQGAIALHLFSIPHTPQIVDFERAIALHLFTRGARCLYLNNVAVSLQCIQIALSMAFMPFTARLTTLFI
uniref:hypothetical protein n=1 Tax=Trichocoleus desertorum TaxID=1481672 RepID=UPI0025B439DC|nr:hypothetical protein [Trichocoleus desertorum]